MATRRLGYAGRSRMRNRLTYATAMVACAGMLAGCGSRVSDASIIQSEGGSAKPATSSAAPDAAATDTGAVAPAAGVAAPAATRGSTTTAAAPAPAAPAAATNGGAVSAPAGRAATTTAAGATAAKAPSSKAGTTTAAGAAAPAAGASCTKPGPPIVLGQVVEYSGIIGANVGSAIPVLGVWSKYINAHGGIACHPVQVFSEDDASDPSRAASQVKDLVQTRNAIGLVGDFIPLSISGFKSALDQVKVPAIGGDLFSTTWWTDPLFYPVGTNVEANAFGSTAAVAKTGADKVAVIYCIEAAVCPPYKDAVKNNADKGGYKVVYDVQVSITAPDYTSQCQSAKAAGANQISMIVEGSGVSRIARSCAAIDYFPKLSVASLGATFDPQDKNVQKMTIAIASAAADWFSTDSKGQQQFQEAMSKYAPSLKLDPTAPLAWADAMMVKAAIEKLGPAAEGVPITTAMLREGLSKIKDETLDGMIKPNSFNPTQGDNPKNSCYFADQFSTPGRWKALGSGCLTGLK